MSIRRRFLASSIGRKILVALTGLLLVGFLIGHVAGNLLIFSGRNAMNDYAQWLRQHPALLWGVRLALLAVFGAHVFLATSLQRENRAARATRYVCPERSLVRFDARSMLLTGGLIAAYLIYHLLHFTLGVVQPADFALEQVTQSGVRHDVYGMVVAGFRHPAVAISYLVALAILFLHLNHGVVSFFQTLGVQHERSQPTIRTLGVAFSGLIVVGYASIPLGIALGLVQG